MMLTNFDYIYLDGDLSLRPAAQVQRSDAVQGLFSLERRAFWWCHSNYLVSGRRELHSRLVSGTDLAFYFAHVRTFRIRFC